MYSLVGTSLRASSREYVCVTRPWTGHAACFHLTAYRHRAKEAKQKGRPRNRDIGFRVVRLVNPETSQLDPPAALSDILARIDQKKEWVELVAATPEPIVKIIKSSDLYNKLQAQLDRKREHRPREEKEIQLTWGISPSDLQHKLTKTRDELEKGNRVDLVYTTKKGQTKPTPEEMEARAQELLDLLADAGKEWQTRVVTKTTVLLHLQGHNSPPPLRSPRKPKGDKSSAEPLQT